MSKIKVVYWSQTGNTKEMADAVAEGINAAGGEAEVLEVGGVAADSLKEDKVFALGCPACGTENLDEGEMEPFVAELEKDVNGKTIGLFGSFGWGGGIWMEEWVQRMKAAGATVVDDAGVICNEAPDEETLENCKDLGSKLVNS